MTEPWELGPPPGFDDAPVLDEPERHSGAKVIDFARPRAANESTPAPSPIHTIGVIEIFAALPPIPYVIGGIFITPGPPTLLGGFGFSGKTVTAQSIALSVASGEDLWGVFGVKQGKVLHLDYEQGERLTRERYQRLALGAGIDFHDLEADVLRLAALPSFYLDSEGALEILTAAFDGYSLAVIDSLRASLPSVDENSSEVRKYLDMLSRVSERTGCSILVIHHARKPSVDRGGKAPDPTMSLRGSSAIFDGHGNVFVMGAEQGEPIRVTHIKERTRGRPIPTFGLRILDVPVGNDPVAGLRVVHLDGEQMSKGSGDTAKHQARIVDFLASKGGTFPGSRRALVATIGMNRNALFDAFAVLESAGRVRVHPASKSGSGIDAKITLNPTGSK